MVRMYVVAYTSAVTTGFDCFKEVLTILLHSSENQYEGDL